MTELPKVGIMDILNARDARVQLQNTLLEKYGLPIVSFTLNIPGDIKNDPSIERAFRTGVARIERGLVRMDAAIAEKHCKIAFTGCEQIWAVDGEAEKIKAAMVAIEDADDLGRLFDIDVIAPDGTKLSRDSAGIERTCIICGGPVHACARSRTHSAAELFARVHEIIDSHFINEDARFIGMCAQRALLTEAIVTPKPGLVDRENSGAHTDMDLFTFADSACVLRGYFEDCARIGFTSAGQKADVVFEKLRRRGLDAEDEMLRMTCGVNTHKGALFSLGILCCAAALHANADIFSRAAALARPALRDFDGLDSGLARTAGEKQFQTMKLTGARGEAAAGFPTVQYVALPALEKAIESGASVNDAALSALVALMAYVDDSNVIKRGGLSARETVREAVANLDPTDHDALRALNAEFTRLNLSPGGCADLLACALFVMWLRGSAPENPA